MIRNTIVKRSGINHQYPTAGSFRISPTSTALVRLQGSAYVHTCLGGKQGAVSTINWRSSTSTDVGCPGPDSQNYVKTVFSDFKPLSMKSSKRPAVSVLHGLGDKLVPET